MSAMSDSQKGKKLLQEVRRIISLIDESIEEMHGREPNALAIRNMLIKAVDVAYGRPKNLYKH